MLGKRVESTMERTSLHVHEEEIPHLFSKLVRKEDLEGIKGTY